MKLFDNKLAYTKLDDDVSFQILRTNPRLATNAKLMYDGTNLYMESYSANALLSTNTYKHNQVYRTGLFNIDMKKFLSGTGSGTYEMGYAMENTIVGDTFDNQFENMYWCGAESINSDIYPQELGFIAPLYIRKKRPDYFVIFKMDTPANTNLDSKTNDQTYDFTSDVLNQAHIVKAFDLRQGTPIGDYIQNYIEQKEFKYDQSVYVNFGAKEIYYYGIDKSTGVLTQKVENIEDQLLSNDNTILRSDDWITNGYARNNLVFPYIINMEFLFDDDETENYHFSRYFGIYCNTIDLYDLDISDMASEKNDGNTISTMTCSDDLTDISTTFSNNDNAFYYLKDKNDNIFTIDSDYNIYGDISVDSFTGYESSTISTYCERLDGRGYATMVLKLNDKLTTNDVIYLMSTVTGEQVVYTFTVNSNIEKEGYLDNDFSCNGTIENIATALSKAISNRLEEDEIKWMNVYTDGDKIIIKSLVYGESWNGRLKIKFSDQIVSKGKITILMKESSIFKESDGYINAFDGGADTTGCMFKIKASEYGLFFDESDNDRDYYRYVKCRNGRVNAKILTVIPYVDSDDNVDEDYAVLITDSNGQYINISETEQMEILDRYYTKLGFLSFFPVRDFDTDTIYSSYGENDMMKNEISEIGTDIIQNVGYEVKITYKITCPDDVTPVVTVKKASQNADNSSYMTDTSYISYRRFTSYTGDELKTEYEYFYENIIPELSTVNKTVPFIAKWGYMDDSVDSCENPYRLNTSKIFDACNFSANTFVRDNDIMEYTHSMPYYLTKEEHYYYDTTDSQYGSNYEYKDYLRNSYQYVYNLTGISDGNDALENWKEYFMDTASNHFEDMFYDPKNTYGGSSVFTSKRFNRKYSRFLLGSDILKAYTLFRGVKFEIMDVINDVETPTSRYNGYRFSFVYIPVNDINDERTFDGKIYFIKNDTFKFIVGLAFIHIYDMNEFNKASVYAGALGYKDVYSSDKYYDKAVDSIRDMSMYNIKMNINNNVNVEYLYADGNDSSIYRIRVCDPDSIDTYDIFTSVPVMMEYDNKNIIGSADIHLKSDTNDLMIKIINRYSGYYNPIFKDILFYNDYTNESDNVTCKFSHTSFDPDYKDNYGEFGIINNLWFHKVNDEKTNIIDTLEPYYPITGQYALDYRDYNIFSSSWDMNYYTKQLDIKNSESCKNISSMKNGLCMFGSKYLNVPEEITLECLDGGEEWNEDWITDTGSCDGEMMYNEINNNTVNFYFFLHKRLVRYLKDKLRDEFDIYMDSEYSYGDKDTIDDDIEAYIEKNILKLYKLDEIRMYVKSEKMGVHNNKIENDYTAYLGYDVSELKTEGFSKVKNISVSKLNLDAFDRKAVYNLTTGAKESFGFSFIIKKI